MIQTIVAIIACLLVSFQLTYAQQFLLAEPSEPTDYYIIKVNGKETSVVSTIEELLFRELKKLKSGKHKIKITSGSFKHGHGGSVRFNLRKRVNKKYTIYKIIRLKREQKKDPSYNDKFDEPLNIQVKNSHHKPPKPPKPDWKDWRHWHNDQNRIWPGWKDWKDWHDDPNHSWEDWRKWQYNRKHKWRKFTDKDEDDPS